MKKDEFAGLEPLLLEKLTDILDYISQNPLIFVSETDIHILVAQALMEIPALNPRKLYDTAATIGRNLNGQSSPKKYGTMALHKEYGHHGMPWSRSDLVILHPDELAQIDDNLDLKVDKKWIVPEYIFEFGTEKAASSVTVFEKHLGEDIRKTAKSKQKGYIIHIHRNLYHAGGGRKERNIEKYKQYEECINEVKQKNPLLPHQRLLVMLIDVGNADRKIYREGKMRIFLKDQFVPVPRNKVKEVIGQVLG